MAVTDREELHSLPDRPFDVDALSAGSSNETFLAAHPRRDCYPLPIKASHLCGPSLVERPEIEPDAEIPLTC